MLLLHHQPNNPNASRSHNIPLPHVIIAGDAGSLSSSGLIVSFPPLPPHLALADHLRLGPTLHHTGGPCCLMRLRLRCEPRRPQLQETTCFRTRTPPTTMTRQAPHTMSLHIGPAQVLLSYYPTTNGDQASHQGDDRRTRSDGRTAHPGPSHHSSVTLPAFVDENRGRNQPGRIPQQSCSRTVPDLSEIAATSDLGRQPVPPTPRQRPPRKTHRHRLMVPTGCIGSVVGACCPICCPSENIWILLFEPRRCQPSPQRDAPCTIFPQEYSPLCESFICVV